MNMNVFPCVHEHGSHENAEASITMKLIYQERERMVYHYPDGKVLKTRVRQTLVCTESSPFNPINCPHCMSEFLAIYGVDGLCPIHIFNDLCQVARSALDRIWSRPRPGHVTVLGNLGVQIEQGVSDAEGLAEWLDSHRTPQGAAAWAIVNGLERVDPLLDQEEVCGACLEQLSVAADDDEDGVVMKMPCGHVFHGSCILDWLLNSHYCPLCRFHI